MAYVLISGFADRLHYRDLADHSIWHGKTCSACHKHIRPDCCETLSESEHADDSMLVMIPDPVCSGDLVQLHNSSHKNSNPLPVQQDLSLMLVQSSSNKCWNICGHVSGRSDLSLRLSMLARSQAVGPTGSWKLCGLPRCIDYLWSNQCCHRSRDHCSSNAAAMTIYNARQAEVHAEHRVSHRRMVGSVSRNTVVVSF